jgi:hypothetical protein
MQLLLLHALLLPGSLLLLPRSPAASLLHEQQGKPCLATGVAELPLLLLLQVGY